MLLNLESRLAQRVLIEVAARRVPRARTISTSSPAASTGRDWITPQQTLRVDSTAQPQPAARASTSPPCASRTRSATCCARPPASGRTSTPRQPDLHDRAARRAGAMRQVYVDSSGESLFKRGWRERQGRRAAEGDAGRGDARRRRLARHAGRRRRAARPVLRLGHDRDRGGADRLRHRAGRCSAASRSSGCCRSASAEQRAEMQRLRSHAQGARPREREVPIFASDVSFRMVDFARRNAERAGVADAIKFNGGDALERPAPALPAELPGTLMINPPYGERIEVAAASARLARAGRRPACRATRPRTGRRRATSSPASRRTGRSAYTGHPAGWTAWMLSPDMSLPSAMRLKESRRVPMWNGPIECRLFRFDLVAGSARGKARPKRPRRRLRERAALGTASGRPTVHSCRLRSAKPSQASSASGAVSARSVREPSETGTKPRRGPRASSSGASPPSGPLSTRRPAAIAAGRIVQRRRAAGGIRQAQHPARARAAAASSSRSQALEADRHGDARHANPTALLARRRRHRLPVAPARLGALAGQAQHRALADQRLQRRGAELGRLLDQGVHALVGRHADRQGDGDRQLALDHAGRARRCAARPRCGRCGRSRAGHSRSSSPLNRRERVARLQPQHLHVARLGRRQDEASRPRPSVRRRWMRKAISASPFAPAPATARRSARVPPATAPSGAPARRSSPCVSRHQSQRPREPGEGHELGLDQDEQPADEGGAEHLGGDDDARCRAGARPGRSARARAA